MSQLSKLFDAQNRPFESSLRLQPQFASLTCFALRRSPGSSRVFSSPPGRPPSAQPGQASPVLARGFKIIDFSLSWSFESWLL